MLVEQTMEKLVAMKLKGMAEALRRWMEQPKEKEMTPSDLVGLLADAEWSHREQRKLTGYPSGGPRRPRGHAGGVVSAACEASTRPSRRRAASRC